MQASLLSTDTQCQFSCQRGSFLHSVDEYPVLNRTVYSQDFWPKVFVHQLVIELHISHVICKFVI